jgi:arylsulfatase A-like enzyme
MSIKVFRSVALLMSMLGIAAMTIHPAAGEDAARPNVVFVLADDFGYADLACYGHPYARTPIIDRLAAEGTQFRQFYATGVTCCPARTGLMTSRFPATFATYPANGGFSGCVTVTELLKRHGYHTGHFGKWHIGPDEKPGTYGIDVIDSGVAGQHHDARGRDAPIFDAAIRFIEQHQHAPFYVNVWCHTPHYPISPPQAYVDKFQDLVVVEAKFAAPIQEKFIQCRQLGGNVSEHMQRYLADVNALDDNVGRLLRRLDELGLRENTLVVFSSDQGPADLRLAFDNSNANVNEKREKKRARNSTDLRLNAMGYTAELRGGKHGMYEGGVRVPFVVRWPGHVPAGRVDEKSMISGIDWLPTICRIAGVLIDEVSFSGEDVSHAWFGARAHTRTKPLFWKTSAVGSDAGIRDGQWKLILPTRKRGETELYDLASDAAEHTNVAAQNPQIVERLSAKLHTWTATLPKEYVKSDDKAD